MSPPLYPMLKRTYHRRATISRHFPLRHSRNSPRLINTQIPRNSPLRSTDRLRSLIELSSHIKIMNSRLRAINSIKADKRVDLEVRKVEVYVDGVQADEEIDERLFFLGWDVGQERRGDGGARGKGRVDGDIELEGFGVDIADIDTTFVCEQDGVTFTCGVDADVILGVRWVREERLDDEVVESASDGLDLDLMKNSQIFMS
jgi:hypothetical protein